MNLKKRKPLAYVALVCLALLTLILWAKSFGSTQVDNPPQVKSSDVPVPFNTLPIWKGEVVLELGTFEACVREVWAGEKECSYQIVNLRLKDDRDVSINGSRRGLNAQKWSLYFDDKHMPQKEQVARAEELLGLAVAKVRNAQHRLEDPPKSQSDDLSRMGQ